MPLNEIDLRNQLPQIIENARRYQEEVEIRRARAGELLAKWDQETTALRDKIRSAARSLPSLRCALPLDEALRARHALKPATEEGILLAADGSQILPDRHAALYYSLVNISIIERNLASNGACRTKSTSRILYGEEFDAALNAEDVSMLRDIQERRILAERAAEIRADAANGRLPIVTLTDGTLELWGSRTGDERDESSFGNKLKEYLNILGQLRDLGTISAAYVDKPHANLIVRMLEIAALEPESIDRAGALSGPLAGVTDSDLFGSLLRRGERSAVFAVQSQSAAKYDPDLAPHFFYLNVSSTDEPWLARVEIPGWMAQNDADVDTLQALLIRQCDDHNLRYPYLLARAHETAVIKYGDKDSVTEMLRAALSRNGIPTGSPSQKQRSKDLIK